METDKEYAIRLAMEYGFTGGFDAQGDLTFDITVVEAILEAIQHEREACAKLCDESAAYQKKYLNTHGQGIAEGCAIVIRARGKE